MRTRHDSVFISAVMFSMALILVVPLASYWVLMGQADLTRLGPGDLTATRAIGNMGTTSFAIISIGLTVVWTGYIKKLRWTWFVMLFIALGWAFPLLLDVVRGKPFWFELLRDALRNQLAWNAMSIVFSFGLMLTALILPIRSFGKTRKTC